MLAIVCASAPALMAGKDSEVRVASSKELRVAVVDATKASAAREAVHQAFASSLGGALSRQCGGPVGVRAKCVGADHAAFNLNAGVYDAVLVIGRSVPDALRKVDALTLSAAPDGGKRERSLYLLIGNGDASLQGLLATAFTGALSDAKFLETFASGGRPVTPAGDKVASSQ
jgi:hypothetical protein